jgi:hypothetical protein
MTNIVRGKLDVTYDPQNNRVYQLSKNGQNLRVPISSFLINLDKNQGHPFSQKTRYIFPKEIETICFEVFDAIKEIQLKDNNVLAAYTASKLFESFSGYWRNELLAQGLLYTGVSFWQELISITLDWESKNSPTKIHKGTPFFFLSYNCLHNGDIDGGFTFLHNAIVDDMKLPSLNYPDDAPAYLTATMSDKKNNFMFPDVIKLRLFLNNQILKFESEFSSFSINEFDKKFLRIKDLSNVVLFFVYNFKVIFDQESKTNNSILQNDFSRLKTLDLFFNLGLIVDETIRYHANSQGTPISGMMGKSVQWLLESVYGLSQSDFNSIIGINDLNLKKDSLDVIIPKIFNYIQNPPAGITKEIFPILLAYKIRNHAGHNLDQQTILTQHYEKILQHMMNALFLVCKVLR